MNSILENKLNNLPTNPGVYQYKDKDGKIIYVGKAKNLKNRVKSYFTGKHDSAKTKLLVSKIVDLELIITSNEIEALVLENNLIKELKPKYNINLKDDKTFPYIRVTNELFPQIFPTRTVVRDGSKYFGPYTDVKSMKNTLRLINQIFKIRSCKFNLTEKVIAEKKIKLCLDYHIKKCDGPCQGLISSSEYKEMVNNVIKLLKGKTDELLNELSSKMQKYSEELNFEKAAELRDTIKQLNVYTEKQKVVTTDFIDRDIIAIAYEGKDFVCNVLQIRYGKLLGKKQLKFTSEIGYSLDYLYNYAIRMYYNEFTDIPKEIVTEVTPLESDNLVSWLNNLSGHSVKFKVPQIQSDSLSLLKMSKENALLQLKEIQIKRMKREGNLPYVLSSLKRDLRLRDIPRRIECFDISNIQGSDTVASMVVFIDGKPKKSEYRKFIIKSVDGPNDFQSMREVISRRYGKLIEEDKPFPDLIMVDGGKGQLSSAVEILDSLGAKDYQIIGLAKRLEEIFFPDNPEAQTIPYTSSSLRLLQHLRDEAHRFAITFHRHRRDKRTLTSELLEIKGIGKKISEKLLTALGSLSKVKSASFDELERVVGKSKAQIIYNHFHKD